MADLIIGGALVLASLAWIAAGLTRAAARPTPNAAAAPEVEPVPPRAHVHAYRMQTGRVWECRLCGQERAA